MLKSYFFFLVFLISINYVLLSNYLFFSKLVNIFDKPNNLKISTFNTPLLGGTFLLINLLIYFCFFYFFFQNNDRVLFNSFYEILIFLILILFIFIVGFIDDKINLSPNLRLCLSAFAFFIVIIFDKNLLITELNFSSFEKSLNLKTNLLSLFFTTFCMIVFLNACNMYDGINLQSSSYFLIFILTLLVISKFFVIYLVLIIFLLFFLILNKNGKIYFGDNGIYLFSTVLSYITIKNYNLLENITVEEIFILMMYPGLDMLRLVVFRIFNRQHPFRGDKNHIHHILQKRIGYRKTITYLVLLVSVTNLIFLLNLLDNLYIILMGSFFYTFTIIYFSFLNKKMKY